jgi:hypothetical protein
MAKNMSILGFLQPRVLLDEFLLTVPREADSELGLVTRAFATEDEASAVLGMPNI